MIKINRKVEYGLVALKHMFSKPTGELTSVREICDHYGTPFDPVAHVMRILNSEGLVQSEQGAYGGYRISEIKPDFSLAQFIEVVEGHTLAFADCFRDEDSRCQIMERCNVVDSMGVVHSKIKEVLDTIWLLDLLKVPNGGGRMPHPSPSNGHAHA